MAWSLLESGRSFLLPDNVTVDVYRPVTRCRTVECSSNLTHKRHKRFEEPVVRYSNSHR